MIRALSSAARGAAAGQAESLVVFLHGYGADGADLLGLADVLAPHLPGTRFVAPDAPEPCRGGGFGRQWFPIPWLDGSSEALAHDGLLSAATDLEAYLAEQRSACGLKPSAVGIIGFSQGAMMALHVTPRLADPVAGVVAIAGRLLAPERLAAEVRARPPVLLIHGDADPVVPFADMARAQSTLTATGFDVASHVMRGTGHGIAPDGLAAALAFLDGRLQT